MKLFLEDGKCINIRFCSFVKCHILATFGVWGIMALLSGILAAVLSLVV